MMRTTLADLVSVLPPTPLPSAMVAEAAVTIDCHRISCVLVALNPQNQVNYANAAAHALCTWHVESGEGFAAAATHE